MDRSNIYEDLELRITQLKSSGAGLLECIKYVMKTLSCGLTDATDIVINSRSWIDRKDDFLQQQSDYFEEFLADNVGRIESIQMTITPDGTEVNARMKDDNQSS